MSFTSLEQFYNNYRIKNEQQPNETTLNRPVMRLKREVRELKSVLDIITGTDIEEWTSSRFYETDEYVKYKESYYISLSDDNIGNTPSNESEFWNRVTLTKINENPATVCYIDEFVADGENTYFSVSKNLSSDPLVFVDGVLVASSSYTYTSRYVKFNVLPLKDVKITIVYGTQYINSVELSKREYTASKRQVLFETPFNLTNPSVFVNGILIPSKLYNFEKNSIEFYYFLKEGDVVTICNGTNLGYDTYSKNELDEQFGKFLTTDNAYTKAEANVLLNDKLSVVDAEYNYAQYSEVYRKIDIDNMINNLNDSLTTEIKTSVQGFAEKGNSLADYGILDAYTKDETSDIFDTLLSASANSGVVKALLESKADTASTISGYGITDAYTKTAVDDLLNTKVESSQFTPDNLSTMLVDTLSKYLQKESFQAQKGGMTFETSFNDDNTENENISINNYTNAYENTPSIEVQTSVSDTGSSSHYRVFSDLNTDDMVVKVEGDFKGYWAFKLSQVGVVDYTKYNWFVEVIPTMTGDNLDFVPKGYGSTFTFGSTKTTSSSQSLYNYGWLDETQSTVNLVSTCQCDDTVKESYAHYVLTGYDKRISQRRTFNQGDTDISGILPKSDTDAQNEYAQTQFANTEDAEVPSESSNALEKLSTDASENVATYSAGGTNYTSFMKVYSDKYNVSAGDTVTLWIIGANIGDKVTITLPENVSTVNSELVLTDIEIDDNSAMSLNVKISDTVSADDTLKVQVSSDKAQTVDCVLTVV